MEIVLVFGGIAVILGAALGWRRPAPGHSGQAPADVTDALLLFLLASLTCDLLAALSLGQSLAITPYALAMAYLLTRRLRQRGSVQPPVAPI